MTTVSSDSIPTATILASALLPYISTGGGALLEAIEGKVLPGVAAIEK